MTHFSREKNLQKEDELPCSQPHLGIKGQVHQLYKKQTMTIKKAGCR